MLSRKDGEVGYLIFNNPERHNAVSHGDVGGDAARSSSDFATTMTSASWC